MQESRTLFPGRGARLQDTPKDGYFGTFDEDTRMEVWLTVNDAEGVPQRKRKQREKNEKTSRTRGCQDDSYENNMKERDFSGVATFKQSFLQSWANGCETSSFCGEELQVARRMDAKLGSRSLKIRPWSCESSPV